MERIIFQFLWLILYWYYVEQVGVLEKGPGRRAVGFGLTAAVLALSVRLPLFMLWLLVTGMILLFDLFFDEESFRRQLGRILLPGLCLSFGSLLPERFVFCLNGAVLCLFLLLLTKKRESLCAGNGILTAAAFGLFSLFLWSISVFSGTVPEAFWRAGFLWGGILLEFVLFGLLERTLYYYKKGYEFQTEHFRQELMEHNYGEIREIYMDMRGWRHDYHNHMQVMKARLAMKDLGGLGEYLDQLEKELDRVDTLVKSGNLMTDAILNSKLTLARRQNIPVNCRADMPERIGLEDVDLCVIIGNLMDNAIEACGQIEEESRFLRVYLAVNKNQFYVSVQNSAREDPGFEERNYITRKRGNHGLGMKRVKAAVDKYGGYFSLANEPGIFAAEVSIPLELPEGAPGEKL